jgi:hypothetical protein
MELVNLTVIGLVQGTTEGNYSLLLQAENSDLRMPILIGSFEAQAIALAIEGKQLKRPLTHDLLASFITLGNIQLTRLVIHGLIEGVFYAHLYYKSDGEEQFINCRPSDGVALAVKFGMPISINKELIDEYGIRMSEENEFIVEENEQPGRPEEDSAEQKSKSFTDLLESYSLEQLQKLLEEAERNEDYEKAALIRDEITKR